MLLLEKIVKHLSQLNEMLSGLEKKSENFTACVTILEDLHSILNESTYKGDMSEIELRGEESQHDDGYFYVEDYISSNLKYSLEKEIDRCFEACQQIYNKQTSGILKKTWQYIKIFLFDNPEEILGTQIIALLQSVLHVRLELKEKNFAILFEEINQTRAQQKYNKKNKRISSQDQIQNIQNQKMNTVYNLKNKNNLCGGDILDEKSNHENQLSFETPLPPDANNQFRKIGMILLKDQNGNNHNFEQPNFFSNQKVRNEGSLDNKRSERKELPDTIKYKLDPQTHPSLLQNQDSNLQEIAICKNISLNEGLTQNGKYSYKDFYSFKRSQYTDILSSRTQDLGRISRNHASLRVKIDKQTNNITYYLVNHSPNGCSVNTEGQWIKVKEQEQEYQIHENDIIGLLFDNNSSDLLIGYKLQFV